MLINKCQNKFFLFTIICIILIKPNKFEMTNQETLISINFEVFGHVQGVFFRKFTKKEADKLDLKGWCRNTSNGTVQGVLEGYAGKVEEMKHWLETKGSPMSRVDKVVFENRKDISTLSYKSFDIRR